MKNRTIVFFGVLFFTFLLYFIGPVNVVAVVPAGCQADCNPPAPGYCMVAGKCQLVNPAPNQLVDFRNFGQLMAKFIDILLYFAGAVAVVFLVIGGYQYVTSRGNEEAMEKAKKTITAAIIGIVIIIMAFAIVQIVNTFLTQPVADQV